MELEDQLDKLFYPETVAVIGTSRSKGKIGNQVLRNLLYGNHDCYIYPVNPKAKKILGMKCFPSVLEVPGDVDLAVIVVPAKAVPKVMEECSRKKITGTVIISSGFSEIGRKDREEEIKNIASHGDMRVIGPNTVGIINTSICMNASFVSTMPLAGEIAFITQSGALGEALIHWTAQEGLGLSKVASLGNKIDVDDADLLRYFETKKDTKVIALYIESIRKGRKFMEAAKEVSRVKPIVAVKAGKSKAGQRATSSHTGALAGEDRVYDAAFKQSGVIRANDTTELFDMAVALAQQQAAKGNRIAIVTNGGGAGVIVADVCEENGIAVPGFEGRLLEKLRGILPEIASPRNPVDILGDADYQRYKDVMRSVARGNAVDGIIALHVQTSLIDPVEVAEARVEIDKSYNTPLVTGWIGGRGLKEARRLLIEKKVPQYPSPKRACIAMKGLIKQGELHG
ncbi:MAG: CoA-binding protein [Candidatus Hydrothermarchaeota archaeon]|nr:CoA-binding protein [Candidatus Hydrothermarchaeota archaeon]